MGRILDIIPPLYHEGDNELIPFIKALDVEIDSLERKIKSITDLINVDKCPDDKLPYLAALTNCPLIGNDPVFWRKQIKNWPYILKLKGTQKSLELVLESIGADKWDIKTFFRDAGGGYITSKPEGKPFKGSDGLWYNIRTHYFSIEFTLSKDFIEKHDFNWDVDEIHEKLKFWFERGKPYHAELLNMIILPPQFLPDDHICKWDVCNWAHVELIPHQWLALTPNEQIDNMSVLALNFERGIFNFNDTAFWDLSSWEAMSYRLLQVGAFTETGIYASFEWGEGDAAMLSPNLWDYSKWDYVKTFSHLIGSEFEVCIATPVYEEQPQLISAFIYTDIICDNRPHWDSKNWLQHCTWLDDVRRENFIYEYLRGIHASLDWNDKRDYPISIWDSDNWDSVEQSLEYDAPLPKWSAFKTWKGSNTWDITNELSGSWQIHFQED